MPSFKPGAEEYGSNRLRGVIVPIVDMRNRFDLAEANYDALTVEFIPNIGQRTVGMKVDAVSDVLELQSDQIKPAPEFRGAVESSHITGIGSVGPGAGQGGDERMLILMDIEQSVSGPEMGLHETFLH